VRLTTKENDLEKRIESNQNKRETDQNNQGRNEKTFIMNKTTISNSFF
jgi:hypothetical protein